jgi:RHS repeat-associated protein
VFTSTVEMNLRLPGQQLHAETGLHQNWMRDYDPMVGRYLQPDPIGLEGGPNVYGYVGSDPLNYVDPRGEFAVLALVPPALSALGSAASAAASAAAPYAVPIAAGIVGAGVLSLYGDTPAGKPPNALVPAVRPVGANDNGPENSCPLVRELPEDMCVAGNRECIYKCESGLKSQSFSRTFPCRPWILPSEGVPYAPIRR